MKPQNLLFILTILIIIVISGCAKVNSEQDTSNNLNNVIQDSCKIEVEEILKKDEIYAGCFSSDDYLMNCVETFVIDIYDELVDDHNSEDKLLFVNDFLTTVDSVENLRGMDCRKAYETGENNNFIYCEGKLRIPPEISSDGTVLKSALYYPVKVVLNNSNKLIQSGFSKPDLFKTNFVEIVCK